MGSRVGRGIVKWRVLVVGKQYENILGGGQKPINLKAKFASLVVVKKCRDSLLTK